MGATTLVLKEEPEVRLQEGHTGSKFLKCYVWFESENFKVCITNDKDIIVFNSFCLISDLEDSDIQRKANFLMERIQYHMPNDGIIYLHLNRNEKGEKFQQREGFDDFFLIDFKRIAKGTFRIGGNQVTYLLEIRS